MTDPWQIDAANYNARASENDSLYYKCSNCLIVNHPSDKRRFEVDGHAVCKDCVLNCAICGGPMHDEHAEVCGQ
jgi:hypothetical protein